MLLQGVKLCSLMSEYAAQRIPEGSNYHFYFTEQSKLDHSDRLVAWFPHSLRWPPFSSVLVFLSISLPSQILFQSNLNPLNIKVSKPRPSFFPSKNWPGQQALAQAGMHWFMLAHTGMKVVPTKWLPSHRGLPKQLQMTALSFSAPILLSPPPYFTILLSLSVSFPPPLFLLIS